MTHSQLIKKQAKTNKAQVYLVVPIFLLTLGISPASPAYASEVEAMATGSVVSAIPVPSPNQELTTNATGDTFYDFPVEASEIITIADGTPVESTDNYDFPDARFDVEKTIALAYSEVGTSRPTGWSAEGECIMSVKRWIAAGNGNWVGNGTPVGNYQNAERITYENVRPGDVMQYVYTSSPTSWVSGVHTLLITGVNSDGTFRIVESNNPGGSGLVSMNDSWLPAPPSGFEAHFYRF